MKIKDYQTDERPREKLLAKGAVSLSNAELVAIILRTGTPRENAVDLGRSLISWCNGSLMELGATSVEKLMEVDGIGRTKAVEIAAAMELGRRMFSEQSSIRKVTISDARMIYDLMIPHLKGLDHEEFWIILLNRANYVISYERLSIGGMSGTVIDARIVVRRAIEKKASGIILVHNHPSGRPEPGTSDIRETERLKNAASALQLSLIDHVIVCDDRYYSFADETSQSAFKSS